MNILFRIEGAPLIMQSDNGKEFVNTVMKNVLESWGVKHVRGRPKHPQTQGQVERANQTIGRSFAKCLHGKEKVWIDVHD